MLRALVPFRLLLRQDGRCTNVYRCNPAGMAFTRDYNCNEINPGVPGAHKSTEEDPEASAELPCAHKSTKEDPTALRADMSVLRVTFDTTLRGLTIKDSNVICETTLQVLRVALAAK